MRTAEPRVSIERLRPIIGDLFDKSYSSGSELARQLNTNTNTLWSWCFRRGMTPDKARLAADVMDRRAADLEQRAARLRVEAQRVDDRTERAAARRR